MTAADTRHHRSNLRILTAVLAALVAGNMAYTIHLTQLINQMAPQREAGGTEVALVVGSTSPYWEKCIAGAKDAADRYGVRLTVHVPTNGVADQNRILNRLLMDGVPQIAISPVNPAVQAELLNLVGGTANLITFDSDAPHSRRKFYLGTDNYQAGRQCAAVLREALPDGGRLVIVCGSLDKSNGRLRRMGLIDDLLGRERDLDRPLDPLDQPLQAGDYTLVQTLSDGSDRAVALEQAKGLLAGGDPIDAIVGIYAYNIPKVLEAATILNRETLPILIGFDDNPATLAGIESGTVYATLVQVPYTFGFEAVRLLAAIATGPGGGPLADSSYFACRVVKQGDLEAFRKEQPAATQATQAAVP